MSRAEDELMGITQRAANEEEHARKKMLEVKLVMLQTLSSSDAWRSIFLKDMRAERDAILSLLASCVDPTTLARETGRLLAYERILSWDREEVGALQAELETRQ